MTRQGQNRQTERESESERETKLEWVRERGWFFGLFSVKRRSFRSLQIALLLLYFIIIVCLFVCVCVCFCLLRDDSRYARSFQRVFLCCQFQTLRLFRFLTRLANRTEWKVVKRRKNTRLLFCIVFSSLFLFYVSVLFCCFFFLFNFTLSLINRTISHLTRQGGRRKEEGFFFAWIQVGKS